ncbi:MAG: lipid-A-disaccharide synthase [Armatimonadota bacterium]
MPSGAGPACDQAPLRGAGPCAAAGSGPPLPLRSGPGDTQPAKGASPPADLSLVIVAGEASGDMAGAALAAALRRRAPAARMQGIGGRRMREQGVELLSDSSGWGAIGVADSLSRIPRVWRALRQLRRRIEEDGPSAIVLIDSGAVNVPLLRMIRRADISKLYYMPPGSWSRRPRSQELPDLVDGIATPFPWSRDLLAGRQARVEWVGHPVVEIARPQLSRAEAYERYAISPDRPVVALAPGSREQEMRHVLPVLAAVAAIIARERPEAQFVVSVSDAVYQNTIAKAFRRLEVAAMLLNGMEYDALQLADVAAVCSGTATLEFACLRLPMVIVYRVRALTAMQLVLFRRLVGRQQWAGMPNIIANKEIVPEFLGRSARPERIARELLSLLADRPRRERMQADLAGVGEALGDGHASERTADLLMSLIAGRLARKRAA